MTDRELLERAAKAAGIKLHWLPSGGAPTIASSFTDTAPTWWNPLTDDGDALRLAVKLRLEMAPCQGCAIVFDGEPADVYVREDGPDEFANMRRAIVRAAAEMAK